MTFAKWRITLADALVDRAVDDDEHAYWRFIEHRNAEPLLPPGPGWMQGAAGIAAYLFRLARVLEQGRGAKVRVFRYKKRKHYRKTRGHRQDFTAVRIDKIQG